MAAASHQCTELQAHVAKPNPSTPWRNVQHQTYLHDGSVSSVSTQGAYQLLIEAHLCQVLLENLRVHIGTLFTNVPVPVHFGVHTLTSCSQT